jgi:hypothetical protein
MRQSAVESQGMSDRCDAGDFTRAGG